MAPLSPAFFACRDDLERFADTASAGLFRTLQAVSFDPGYLADLGLAWRRLDGWVRLMENREAGAMPKRAWFAWRSRPDPNASRDLPGEVAGSIAALAGVRDKVLHQIVATDRIVADLARSQARLEAARSNLAALGDALRVQVASPSNPALANAIAGEILPVVAQQEEALLLDLALATRARLELAAIQHGDKALGSAIEQAIKAARFAGGLAEAAGVTNQRLAAVERERGRLRDAAALGGARSGSHPDQIDPSQDSAIQIAIPNLCDALAGMAAAMAQLGTAREQLGSIANQGLSQTKG